MPEGGLPYYQYTKHSGATKESTMAGKKATSKPAGKQKIQAGPSGKMHSFSGVGTQKPGVTAVTKGSTGGKFAKGGPSGKMQKFSPVKAARKA